MIKHIVLLNLVLLTLTLLFPLIAAAENPDTGQNEWPAVDHQCLPPPYTPTNHG